MVAQGQNPFLPPTAFIPDGEPHVFTYKGEERLFIYGSRDEKVTDYCGYGHDVWSAPVSDLTKWTNHGEIFNIKQIQNLGYGKNEGANLGAPDCVYNPLTKKYYLYTFLLKEYKMDGKEGPLPDTKGAIPGYGDWGPSCFMSESDSPTGPFVNLVVCDWPPAGESGAFDPSVLVDEQEDGSVKVYAFWGNRKGDRWAHIDPEDMHTIIDPITAKKLSNKRTNITPREVAYKTLNNPVMNRYSTVFEASSIKRVAAGKYVFIYSPNSSSLTNDRYPALAYCYSNSPEGPWTYGGIIVDNGKNWDYGNNHGSIAKVNDQWYVVYHKSTSNSYNRQAMIEPIEVRIDGDRVVIPEVEMTSQGIYSNGLDAFRRYNVNTICYKSSEIKIDGAQRNPDGLNPIVGINKNDALAGVKYLNFGNTTITDSDKLNLRLNIKMFSPEASVTVQLVPKGDFDNIEKRITLGCFALTDYMKADEDYHEISLPITGLKNNAALNNIGGLKGQLGFILVFNGSTDGSEICRIKEYEFAKDKAPTPNPLRKVLVEYSLMHGKVEVCPVKARSGESVKVSVTPDIGHKLQLMTVKAGNGKVITIDRNANAPYAPQNFSFEMPAQEVVVHSEFIPVD
jgi:hypothetical protein